MTFLSPNIQQWIWLLTLAVLIVSVCIDRTRFRNCFYLLLNLLAFAVYALSATYGTAAGGILAVLFAVLLIFLFLIVPVLLIVNGFIMLRREGRSLANLLSLLFGIFVLAGEVGLFCGLSRYDMQSPSLWLLGLGLMVLYIGTIFLAFLLYSVFRSWIPRRTTFDYVIIHGCGLISGNQISRLLENRIRKGMEVYRRSMSDCRLICSGGRGSDEAISEAEAMREYLLAHGIPEKDILMESSSESTIQNLKNSRDIMEQRGGRMKVALVTSNYHVLRALIYARRLNLSCSGIGAPVAFYYWPSAMIREFIALMRDYLGWFVSGAAIIELPVLYMLLSRILH